MHIFETNTVLTYNDEIKNFELSSNVHKGRGKNVNNQERKE